ncbi:MAG: hypothetical protein JNM10_14865 [Planctomycetia bacterium]|nr:hypothetical protein [Planctomycetia bacterium]
MFGTHKVVCVTPAGRRRYLRLLVPQVLASGLVDRYDLWVNTAVPADLAFFDEVARLDPRVRLVPHPEGAKPSVEAIGAFSRLAMDDDTVYVRLDDDVVWLEPGFFETLLAFRVANPAYFMVSPLVLNNAVCSNILQAFGKIVASRPVTTTCLCKVGWRDPDFALALHRLGLDLFRRGEAARLHCGPVEIALNRFSINCISWFGRDMALAGGVVGTDEEEELSATMATRLRRRNCFVTDTVAAHFAFYSQRELLDTTDVLAAYEALLRARPALVPLLDAVAGAHDRAQALDDGATWGWPPLPVKRWFRLRRWFPKRRRRPRVTLRPGPNL